MSANVSQQKLSVCSVFPGFHLLLLQQMMQILTLVLLVRLLTPFLYVRLKIFICSLAALSGDYGFLVAELPPRPLLERLARELRRRLVNILVFCFHQFVLRGSSCVIFLVRVSLSYINSVHFQGLRLFNIDMIREHGMRDVFYVIDINYFPGRY